MYPFGIYLHIIPLILSFDSCLHIPSQNCLLPSNWALDLSLIFSHLYFVVVRYVFDFRKRSSKTNMTVVNEWVSGTRFGGWVQSCRESRRLVLVIVAIALLLDNMLLTTVGKYPFVCMILSL